MQAIALMGRLAELRPKLFSSFREDKVKDSMDFWDSLVVDPIDLVHSLVMSSECPSFLDKQTQKNQHKLNHHLDVLSQKLGSGPSSSSSEGSAAVRGKWSGSEASPLVLGRGYSRIDQWMN